MILAFLAVLQHLLYHIPLCSPSCIHHVRLTFLPDTYSSLFSLCITFLSVLHLVSITCLSLSPLFSFLIHIPLCFPYVSHSSLFYTLYTYISCVSLSSLFSSLFLSVFPLYRIPFCSPPCIQHVRISFLPLLIP
jgi:hypothetical protein